LFQPIGGFAGLVSANVAQVVPLYYTYEGTVYRFMYAGRAGGSERETTGTEAYLEIIGTFMT
jgi:hypothetical protein